jgi:riboflavin synthase
MFTGIVQGTGILEVIEEKQDFRTHRVRLPEGMAQGLEPGASVAHNGCCLTLVGRDGDLAAFDLERAARFGDEIGGHQMSGHIMCTAEVTRVVPSENNHQVWFRLAADLMRYVFAKGYIGIDGISLTIGEVAGDEFNVNLIPETLERTNIGTRRPGDRVNIEIDPQTQAIVDTVERVMAARSPAG